jgi:hypothetical protein
MRIDAQEMERRLNSNKNLANKFSVSKSPVEPEKIKVISIEPEKRTPPADTNTRILAGTLSRQQPAKEVAAALNLTIDQVYKAKNSKNPAVANGRDAAISRVQELALEKTIQALGLMTDEKFFNANLKDLSIVAANMARVVEKTAAKESSTSIQLVVYTPEQRSERSYRTIDV